MDPRVKPADDVKVECVLRIRKGVSGLPETPFPLLDQRQKIVDRLLGVAVEHAGIVLVEQRVLDAGITRSLTALGDDDQLGFPHFQNRMPAMGEFGSSCAAGLTMSLEPMTMTTSVLGKSSLISSISSTMS